MKKPKGFSGSLVLFPILMLMTFLSYLLLPNYSYGDSFPVIGYTTQQMSVNGTQNLTASGGSGGPYTWDVINGGGSLSAGSGDSVIYTAPASNPNCVNNPTIQVTDLIGNSTIINLAVNAIQNLIETAYILTDSPQPCINHTESQCCWKLSTFKVSCDGSIQSWYKDCEGCDAPPPGTCIGCYFNYIYVPPPQSGCWGQWVPDTGSLQCSADTLLARCIAKTNCGDFNGIPISCNGPTDVRTQYMKNRGCCPTTFISPCQMHITSINTSASTINLSSGQGTTINGTISGNPGGTTNWTVTVEGTGWTQNGTGDTVSAYWDGRDPLGKDIPPGVYTITLTAQTVSGTCNGNIVQRTITINVTANPQQCLLVEGGSSVNAASGNLNHSQTLFRLPNAKFKGEFALAYNSFDGRNTPLGLGWTHSFNIQLLSNNDGSYTIIEGDGQKAVLYSNGGRYSHQKSNYPALTKYSDNTFSLEYKDGLFYHFNSNKIITSIADRNANTTSFTYDSGNNLTGLLDSSGRSISLQYDQSNRISLITDPMGNIHTFTYTDQMLTGISSQIVLLGVQNWLYTYDANGFMLTKTDPMGFVTAFSYYSDYRLYQTLDPQGRYRTISYNPSTNSTQIIEKDGGIWTYTYDPTIGALTGKTDPLLNNTEYFYDNDWNLYKVKNPRGYETSYTYDANDNMTSVTDPLGNMTIYAYNALNKITSITVYPDNALTSFTYDANVNLLSMTDPMNYPTQYGYDSRGNLTSILNPLNQTTTLGYNTNNYLTSITDSTTAITSFTYDSAGNLQTQTDPLNNPTSFQYNGLNKVVRITDPLGQHTDFTYDLNGNLASKTDGNSNLTQYQNNYQGQVTQITDALNQITRFAYGTGCPSCGSGVDQLTSLTDARGQTTAFEYNLAGKLIKETNPLGDIRTYTYDQAGNRVTMTDEKNNTTQYTYDQLNRLTQVLYPDSTTKALGYDARANVTSGANPNIGYVFSYDLNNRLIGVLDSNGKTIAYQYNALNNRSQMTTPDGRMINYFYDNGNRLSQIVTPQGTFTYSYDPAGRRTGLTYPNGVNTTYTYNPASYIALHK